MASTLDRNGAAQKALVALLLYIIGSSFDQHSHGDRQLSNLVCFELLSVV